MKVADKETAQAATKTTPEIERYLAIWERDPKSRVFAPLAEAYRRIGELDRAIEVCQRGLQVHANYVSGRVALGRAYFDKGDLKGAKAQLELVYEADPENLVAAKTLGDIYEAEGELDKALLCYRLAFYTTPSATEIGEKIEAVQKILENRGVTPPDMGPEAEVAPESAETAAPRRELSPLEAARLALRKSEAEAAGEKLELAEDEESESDLREEIERLRRVPERMLVEKDDLEIATDEFFSDATIGAKPVKTTGQTEHKNEIKAQSLTELMLRQGYTQRAVKVYEEYLLKDPGNEQAKQRIKELRMQLREVEREIQQRQGETPKKAKEAVDPAIINSLQEWLRRVREGA